MVTAHPASAEDLSSIPSIRVGQLTATTPVPVEPDTSGLAGICIHMHVSTHKCTYTYNFKKGLFCLKNEY